MCISCAPISYVQNTYHLFFEKRNKRYIKYIYDYYAPNGLNKIKEAKENNTNYCCVYILRLQFSLIKKYK